MTDPVTIGVASEVVGGAAGSAGGAGAAGGASAAGGAGVSGGVGAGQGATGGAADAGTAPAGGQGGGSQIKARPGGRSARGRRPGGQPHHRHPAGGRPGARRQRPGSEPGHREERDEAQSQGESEEHLEALARSAQVLSPALSSASGALSEGGPKLLFVGLVLVAAVAAGLFLVLIPILVIAGLGGGTGSTATQIGTGTPIPTQFTRVFNEASQALDVNPYLLASVAYQESSFSVSDGLNASGCAGFMQLGMTGACGDSWDEIVTLTGTAGATGALSGAIVVHKAYQHGVRPPDAGLQPPVPYAQGPGSDLAGALKAANDPYTAVMAAAVLLRGKVGGQPIPQLDNTAYQALCGYYGACGDSVAGPYAQDVLSRAEQWQSQSALTSDPGSGTGSVGTTGYVNPFTGDSVLDPERTDQGVDYALAPGEPIRAIALARVVGVIGNWYQGEPLIWYQLLDGPYQGRYVYVAEQIDDLAAVGQQLLPGQPVAYYKTTGTGIETGWALANGATLASANGGYAEGRSTAAGDSFRVLLAALGAPTCTDAVQCLHTPLLGTVPAGYPAVPAG